MRLSVYNQQGKEVGKAELPSEIFEIPINQDLVHQAVVAQMANARQVIAKTKDRSEVRGGGRKPWKQKGTGKARHGSRRSPIWVGGGVTFGPTGEQNYKKKINKKMKRKALFMVLSSKAKDEEIILLDELKLGKPKTKNMVEALNQISNIPPKARLARLASRAKRAEGGKYQKLTETKKQKVKKRGGEFLVVLPQKDEVIIRANRNIPYSKTLRANSLNVLDLLSYKYLVMTKGCIDVIKETYMKK